MVRAIVGTMLDINSGRFGIGDLQEIIESNDRSKAGKSAAAHGLFLEDVGYDMAEWKEIEDERR